MTVLDGHTITPQRPTFVRSDQDTARRLALGPGGTWKHMSFPSRAPSSSSAMQTAQAWTQIDAPGWRFHTCPQFGHELLVMAQDASAGVGPHIRGWMRISVPSGR